jgi:hypothetical protein
VAVVDPVVSTHSQQAMRGLGWAQGVTIPLFCHSPHPRAAGNCLGDVSWFLLSHSEVPRSLFQSRILKTRKQVLASSQAGVQMSPHLQGWVIRSVHFLWTASHSGLGTWLHFFLAFALWV